MRHLQQRIHPVVIYYFQDRGIFQEMVNRAQPPVNSQLEGQTENQFDVFGRSVSAQLKVYFMRGLC